MSTVNILQLCCRFEMFHNRMIEKYLFLCFQNLSRNLRVLESGPKGPLVSGRSGQRELKKIELWGHQFQPENIQFHLFFLLELSV